MKKELTRRITQHFLSRSNHHHIQRVSKVAFLFNKQATQVQIDEKYLNQCISKINCDFLIGNQHKQFAMEPSSFLKMNIILSNPYLVQPTNQNKQISQIVAKMISSIKKLSVDENLIEVYQQIKQLILEIDEKQIHELRKYLLYINKWIQNHQDHFDQQSQHCALQLRKLVLQKICFGNAQSLHQLQIRIELVRQEVLQKARQNMIQGDFEQARQNYEIVFLNLDNSEAVRMEALQYLCRSLQQSGDTSYLLTMIRKVKQKKEEEKHMNCVHQTLTQLTHEYLKYSKELAQ